MYLNEQELKEISNLIKKSILKENQRYKSFGINLSINILDLIIYSIFIILGVTGPSSVIAIAFLIWTIFIISDICFLVKINKDTSSVAEFLALKYAAEYDDYNELLKDLKETLGYEKEKDKEEKTEYTKDGKPIIDVDFTPAPETEVRNSEATFEPDPEIIDVEFTPVKEEPTLEQNIDYLRQYVNEVAYDGYETDLAIIDTMYDLVVSGTASGLALNSIENSLHTLTDAIFLKACKHYGLPETRKRVK